MFCQGAHSLITNPFYYSFIILHPLENIGAKTFHQGVGIV